MTDQPKNNNRYPGEIMAIIAAVFTLIPPLSLIALVLGIISVVKMKKAGVVGWQKKFFAWYSIALASVELIFVSLMLISIFSGTACFENKAYSNNPVPEAITCKNNINLIDFFDMLPSGNNI
jgi:hypothetical protein